MAQTVTHAASLNGVDAGGGSDGRALWDLAGPAPKWAPRPMTRSTGKKATPPHAAAVALECARAAVRRSSARSTAAPPTTRVMIPNTSSGDVDESMRTDLCPRRVRPMKTMKTDDVPHPVGRESEAFRRASSSSPPNGVLAPERVKRKADDTARVSRVTDVMWPCDVASPTSRRSSDCARS